MDLASWAKKQLRRWRKEGKPKPQMPCINAVPPLPPPPPPRKPSVQDILRMAKNVRRFPVPKVKIVSRRSERIEALMNNWADQLADPNTDPVEFLLRKMAEITVDLTDE